MSALTAVLAAPGHADHVAHAGHGGTGPVATWAPVAAVAALVGLYLVAAARQRRDRRGWSGRRTAAFVAGGALLGLALVPSVLPFAPGDLRRHAVEHLLIAMVAPLGLVLGAPLTLLLRSVRPVWGGRIGALLRWAPVRRLAHPVPALVLNLGGMAALYFTPLYALSEERPVVHHLVHLHLLLAGLLWCWVIAGPDPAPRRPSVPARLVALGVAIAGHAVMAQLLYAGLFVHVDAPPEQLRGAGELMYYGGDLAELALALALVRTWSRRDVRAGARAVPAVAPARR